MNIGIIASQYRSGVVVPPGDTTIPVITLTGGSMTIDEGVAYVEPGYSASDNIDGDITANVIVNYGGLNTSNPVEGVYTITYNVSDAAGNAAAQKSRTVTVEAVEVPVDTTPPTPPTNVQVVNIQHNTARVTWDASTDNVGVTEYKVYVSFFDAVTQEMGPFLQYNLTTVTGLYYDFQDGQIFPDEDYVVKVRAYDAAGNWAESTEVAFSTPVEPAGVVSDVTYASTYGSGQNFGYSLYVPGNYNPSVPMALVIWLHGQGERSTDAGNPQFWKLKGYGPLWENINNGKEYPFIIFAPQQPEQVTGQYATDRTSFDNSVINESLNHLKASYNIDLDRVYLTGQSMGGGGCVAYLRDHGATIAAAFIICPISTSSNMCLTGIKNTPQWYVHNRQDNVVNISSTVNYINNMNACSPAPPIAPKATIFEGGLQHNGWSAVYGETSPGTLSSDGSIGIPAGYNEVYPESGTGLNWYEWLLQYSL